MQTKRVEFARSIGGRWLVYIPPYAWLLPLWWSGSLLSTPHLAGWAEFWLLSGISLIALAVTCAVFLVLRVTLWRASRTGGTTHILAILTGGVLLGATKASITVAGMYLATGTRQTELLGRILASSVLGTIIVIAVPLSLAQLEKYRAQRTELITALAQTSGVADAPRAPGEHAALTAFIAQSLRRLQAARSHPTDVVTVLEDMRENDIRPLSHRIWKREHFRVTDFTLLNLMSVSLSNTYFVAWPVVVGFAFLMGPSEITAYGTLPGLLALALQSLIIFLCLAIAKSLRAGGKAWGVSVFVTTNIVMTLTIGISTSLIFGPIPSFLPLQANLAVLQVLATLTLFTSVYHLTRRTQRAIDGDLLRLNPSLPQDALAQARQRRADRDLAELLHSQVQNVFLAKAVELKSTLRNPARGEQEVREASLRVIDDLERYLHTLLAQPVTSLGQTLEDVLAETASVWQPVIDVHWAVDGSNGLLTQTDVEMIASVVREAITNAVRHGLAARVDVRISLSPTSIDITVDDDGVGPRGGTGGLGLQLFSTIPHAHWSLTTDSPLGGARLTLSVQR